MLAENIMKTNLNIGRKQIENNSWCWQKEQGRPYLILDKKYSANNSCQQKIPGKQFLMLAESRVQTIFNVSGK